MTRQAVLGLGTNLGDRGENLRHAIGALNLVPGTEVIGVSKLYETAPFDVPDPQDNYWNCCVLVQTDRSPRALLGACLGIEAAMGRVRKGYHGARVIDIDLLLFEGAQSDDPELRLPHPGILERGFVLAPLGDLFPGKNAVELDFSAQYAAVSPEDAWEIAERLEIP